MSDKIHGAQEASGPRYHAVVADDREVRLLYHRSRKTWVGFSLFPAVNERSKLRTFKSRESADSFLAVVPDPARKGKTVFSDRFVIG